MPTGREAYSNIEVIQKIKRMRNKHHGRRKTFTEIAQYLNEKCIPSPTGIIGGWSAQTCKNIAKRETPTEKKKRLRKLNLTDNDHLSVTQAADLYAWLNNQIENGNYRERRASRIILIFLLTGLRREELCRLQIKGMPCYHGHNGITVRGKGNTLGTVRITPVARKVLDQVCGERRTGYVLTNEAGKRYHVRSINQIFDGARRKTNLRFLRPHVLRHTYASILLWSGCDIVFVKNQLRHLNIATTSIYSSLIDEQFLDEPDTKIADLLRAINPKHPDNIHRIQRKGSLSHKINTDRHLVQ